MLICEHVALAPLTTLGVGGPARYFVEATTEAEVIEAVEFARSRQVPLFVLGGGSNLLVADAGFAGLVLKVGIAGSWNFTTPRGDVLFTAGAGEDWDTLVARTVDADCAGLECLSAIPGTVGGTPVQNVGAYGQEVSETIREVRAIDLQSLQTRILSNAECGFTYRSSIFNTTEHDRYIILQVSFALRQGGRPNLRYADLQKFFAPCASDPTLSEQRCAKSATARPCSSFPAMRMRAVQARSSRIPSCRSFFSKSYRRVWGRADCNCPAIPPATVFASCPRPGWSSRRDLPRATARVRRVSRGGTLWQSSIAAVQPLPTSLP
jgi:UDP-N-acetylenolpyruvoylglucosamine reductase